MTKKHWVLIMTTVALVVLVPLCVDWLIIGNDFPSNISNSDWVGFLGEYVGAIIGAIVALVGLIVTIRLTKEQTQAQIDANLEQYEDQKRLNYIPILDCQLSSITEGVNDDSLDMTLAYPASNQENVFPATIVFDVCNIGTGAASDLQLGLEIDGEVQCGGLFWRSRNRVIRAQESYEQKVSLNILDGDKDFKPTILFFYEDVLGNKYRKAISLDTFFDKKTGKYNFYIEKQDKGQLCTDTGIGIAYCFRPVTLKRNMDDK